MCADWWGKEKGTLLYKSNLADPTFLCRRGPSATSRRTVRLYNFRLTFPLKLPLINFSQHQRTVRGPLVDHPRLAQWTHHLYIRSLPDAPMTRGPSAILWQTVLYIIFAAETFLQSIW